MKINIFFILLILTLMSCGNNDDKKKPQEELISNFENKGYQLIHTMTQKVGDYEKLREKKDVIYTYTYQTPDGKVDKSTEKYVFGGELSYGAYHQHERTLPDLEGLIEQAYDGKQFWLKHNGEIVKDKELLKKVAFNRPTNFYWFTMMQKLMDDGLNYEYIGGKTIDDQEYDIVKVTFDSTEKETTDIYQLYINKKTNLVDQFLFTVADFNVMDTPYLMKLEYENIGGILLPANRKYKKSTWEAKVTDEPWTEVTWSNIKFNNGLTKEDFKK